jgi:hypothetical protein
MKKNLNEAEKAVRSVSKEEKPVRLSVDSLDDQIDGYIMKYEKRSKVDKLEESFENRNLGFLLEADESTKTEAPPKMVIDVRKFTNQLARLIMNSESLLDPSTVIINRAAKFLDENYEPGYSTEMLDYLETKFNITPSDEVKHDDAPLPPPAVGAFGGGGAGT